MEFWSWDCVVLVLIEMIMGVTGIVLNLMVVSTVRSQEKLQVHIILFRAGQRKLKINVFEANSVEFSEKLTLLKRIALNFLKS
jgi:hypothetical protein